ncbi:MAG: hypothetical protein VYA30_15880 [Myxococcota bacterium]|nr:hypothetical protein [Myxococcota bacterium]
MCTNKKLSPLLVAILMVVGCCGCTRKTPGENQKKRPVTKKQSSQTRVISPVVMDRLRRHESRQGVNKPILTKVVVDGLLRQNTSECQARCASQRQTKSECLRLCAQPSQLKPQPTAPQPKTGTVDPATP